MDSRLVEYLTWFKENEKRMNPFNNLASSAIYEPENAILDSIKSQKLSDQLSLHDPWWHPTLLQHLKQQYSIADGRELIITNGASGAIWLVFQSLISPGSHIVVESPTYQPLLSVPKFLKAEISLLERKTEKDYEFDREGLEALLRPDTKLIVLTNLHNPSGYPLENGVLSWLKETVKRHGKGITVLIDETFRDLAPGNREVAANLDECFISINTLSKAYGLAALRCGWIVSSQETYAKIRDTYVLVENAGSRLTESLAAIMVEHLDDYRQRSWAHCVENQRTLREFMNPLIAEQRISGQIPVYGCLYFPRIVGMDDTEEFARELRDSWDVYIAPGHFFEAPQHIRIGFGGEAEHLPGKLKRLSEAIRSRTNSVGRF